MADDFDFLPSGPGDPPPRPPRRVSSKTHRPQMPQVEARKVVLIAIPLFLVGAILLAFVTGRGGIVEVSDTEVAVIVNYLTGDSALEDTPGYKVFAPFIQQAFVFDSSPNNFIMEGERNVDENHVKKLTVRANDGSNFWFEKLEIQYQLIPGVVPHVLNDSGPGDAFKTNWVRAYARSVLRDEFGRFSAEEVADQTSYNLATTQAELRLNELLEPHGIEIIKIITPKPKFDPRYEQTIEDRKVADQEVEKLKFQADQLLKERDRKLAAIERDKAAEFEQLLGQLEASRIAAEKDRVRDERSADAFRIEQIAEGQAKEHEDLQRAVAMEEEARKEAEGLRARVEALAQRGDVLVREALARKLANITFQIVPYRRDPAPVRIEHMNAVVPAMASGEQQ